MESRITIGVCGYGFTGSGAVMDLLKEFPEVKVLDQVEFKLSYIQDGIEDLSYHLIEHPSRYFSSDPAIRRFKRVITELDRKYQALTGGKFRNIVQDYLESIIQVTWMGSCFFHKIESSRISRIFRYVIMSKVRKLLYRYGNIWISYPDKKMYFSLSPENFQEHSRHFLNSIIDEMGGSGQQKVVLNQPFPADRPEFSFPFFDEPYAICISRDPRDLYILAKEFVKPRARFIPTDSVEKFIKYYKSIMENAESSQAARNRVLRLNFEDLIYAYDATVKRIADFLQIEKQIEDKYFDPNISIRNTQLFKRTTKYDEDIKQIESTLSKWLYAFPDTLDANTVGKRTVF